MKKEGMMESVEGVGLKEIENLLRIFRASRRIVGKETDIRTKAIIEMLGNGQLIHQFQGEIVMKEKRRKTLMLFTTEFLNRDNAVNHARQELGKLITVVEFIKNTDLFLP
jgi:hypothetical protein